MTGKSDAQIQQHVLDELGWDTRVRSTEVGVLVDAGVVVLTGSVDSYAKKVAAAEAAHRVAGVRDVANDLAVRITSGLGRTDAEIAKAARHALEWDTLVPEEGIRTTVSDGWVTLEGSVPFLHDKQDAERAIRNLRGVTGITNHLAVSGETVHEGFVKAAIEDALARRVEREARRIRVSVKGHAVSLDGTVQSYGEKRAVLGAASHAPGVAAVADHIKVNPFTPAA